MKQKSFKNRCTLLLFLPFLSSCVFSLNTFGELSKIDGAEALEAFQATRDELDRLPPTTFALSSSVIEGVEENRNPLFGTVIYQSKSKEETTTLSYSLQDCYLHLYTYSFLEEEGYQSEEYYMYLKGRTLSYGRREISKEKEGEEVVDVETGETSYEKVSEAKEAFKGNTESLAKDTYAYATLDFESFFDSIPSHWNKNSPTQELHYYSRNNNHDFKIECMHYSDALKKDLFNYYQGVESDYLPFSRRLIERHYEDNKRHVYEENVSIRSSIRMTYPTFPKK